jgi:apolipoprotein N-acyltransferase
MGKKNNNTLPPWLLFLSSGLLLSAGWLMKPFPIFIFFGFAPLFAIADQAKENDDFWIHTEFILLTLFTSFFAAFVFDSTHLIAAILHAIVFTFAFLAYSFSFQNLGSRLGKFTIIFFWLGIEYVLLKLPWRNDIIFLADAASLKTSWLNWTGYTGYLGATLWILCTNLLLYFAVFKGKLNLVFLVLTAICLIGPVIASYFISVPYVNRDQMITLYTQGKSTISVYSKQGELVPRTAAWISLLILLLAFVKNQTKKK